MYSEYVNLGMRAAANAGNQRFAKHMFEVSEQHKSASFRELLRTGLKLPPEYWEALANYRASLTSSGEAESQVASKALVCGLLKSNLRWDSNPQTKEAPG